MSRTTRTIIMMWGPEFQSVGRSVTLDGAHMRNLRLQLGLTQENVAVAVGYSDRLVRKLEKGGPISRKTLNDFVAFYDDMLRQNASSLSELDVSAIRPQHAVIPPQDDASSVQESLVRTWFDRAYNQRDLDVIDELFETQVKIVADGRVLRGRGEIRKRIGSMLAAFDPLCIEIEKIVAQENIVVAYWQVEKTHSGPFLGLEPTGRTVTMNGSSMALFRSNQIVEVRDHWDVHDLVRKLTQSAE